MWNTWNQHARAQALKIPLFAFSQSPCSCCPGLEFQCGVIFRWLEWSATWNLPVLYPPTPEPLQKCPANRWAITSIIINIIKSHPYVIFSDTFTRQDRTNMCWYCTFKWIDPNQNSFFKTLIFKLFALLDHYFKFFFANQCINLVYFKAFRIPCRKEVKKLEVYCYCNFHLPPDIYLLFSKIQHTAHCTVSLALCDFAIYKFISLLLWVVLLQRF